MKRPKKYVIYGNEFGNEGYVKIGNETFAIGLSKFYYYLKIFYKLGIIKKKAKIVMQFEEMNYNSHL